MFGRFGWAEILVIVILFLILFGHNKIPGMMKNLAEGIKTFRKEIKENNAKKAAKKSGSKNKTSGGNLPKVADKVEKPEATKETKKSPVETA